MATKQVTRVTVTDKYGYNVQLEFETMMGASQVMAILSTYPGGSTTTVETVLVTVNDIAFEGDDPNPPEG